MSANDEMQQKLHEGIEAARHGDRATGRRLLQEVLDMDPGNEMAWMWMASCVTTLRERRDCLEQVLTINPANARAKEALDRLDAAAHQPQPESRRDTVEQLRRQQGSAVEKPRPAALPRPAGEPVEAPKGFSLWGVTIAVLGIVAAVLVVLIGLQANPFQSTEPTPIPTTPAATLALLVFPTNTSTAPPRSTRPIPTPTLTLPPTDTPIPSPTPYPLSEFQALSLSMELGAVQPSLYQLTGDGQQETLLGGDFRDVAVAPDGLRIAFIRDVEYPAETEGGESKWFPELHVAELNNLAGARAITQMRAPLAAHPTWSPEGDAIVFVSDAQGTEDLWYVAPDGLGLRALTSNTYIDRDPAWSPAPGSRLVVFASDEGSFGATELYSIEIGDPGVALPYNRITHSSGSSYSPVWSPDGQWIAFISDRQNDADVYYMRADGRNPQSLTLGDEGAEDRYPAFTPDGRFIVFVSNRQEDRFQAYLVLLAGGDPIRLTDNPRNDVAVIYLPEPDLSGAAP